MQMLYNATFYTFKRGHIAVRLGRHVRYTKKKIQSCPITKKQKYFTFWGRFVVIKVFIELMPLCYGHSGESWSKKLIL